MTNVETHLINLITDLTRLQASVVQDVKIRQKMHVRISLDHLADAFKKQEDILACMSSVLDNNADIDRDLRVMAERILRANAS